MKLPPIPNWAKAGLIIALAAGYIAFSLWVERQQKMESATSFSRGGSGLSAFLELAIRSDTKVTVGQEAFFSQKLFTGMKTLMLIDPSALPSGIEEQNLFDYVKKGGLLIISLQGRKPLTSGVTSEMRDSLGNKLGDDNPTFENGKAEILSPKNDLLYFKKKERYAFYAHQYLAGPECDKDRFSCYVRVFPHGSGKILLLAGTPPFNNQMIGKADNREFVFRIQERGAPIFIDEYHHFFSDRTFFDMLKRPAFGLSLLAIGILTLLFFFFAHSEFHELTTRPALPRAHSFESLADSLAYSLLGNKQQYGEALQTHLTFLQQMFPRDAAWIHSQAQTAGVLSEKTVSRKIFLERAQFLIELHHQLMKKKGRLT